MLCVVCTSVCEAPHGGSAAALRTPLKNFSSAADFLISLNLVSPEKIGAEENDVCGSCLLIVSTCDEYLSSFWGEVSKIKQLMGIEGGSAGKQGDSIASLSLPLGTGIEVILDPTPWKNSQVISVERASPSFITFESDISAFVIKEEAPGEECGGRVLSSGGDDVAVENGRNESGDHDGQKRGKKRGRPPKCGAECPITGKRMSMAPARKSRRKDDDFVVSDDGDSEYSDSDYEPWPESAGRSSPKQGRLSRKNGAAAKRILPPKLREDRGEVIQPVCCLECGELLANPFVAYKHYATDHVRSREHVCSECGRSFSDGESLRLHEESHAREFRDCATCIDCRRTIEVNPPSLIKRHVESKHGGVLRRSASEREASDDLYLKCLYCKFFCGYDFLMKLHVYRAHFEESDRGRIAFGCERCGARFHLRKGLVVHSANECSSAPLRAKAKTPEYRCDQCGESAKTKSDLRKHVTANHKAVSREIELCPECGRQLSRESLANHRATKHGVGEVHYHECNMCPMRFRGRYTYLRHLAKEHGVGEMAHLSMKKREDKPAACAINGEVHRNGVVDSSFAEFDALERAPFNTVDLLTKMSEEEISEKLTKEETAIEFLQECNLLARARFCKYGHPMKLSTKLAKSKKREKMSVASWRCDKSTCQTTIGVRVGTWFANSRITIRTALRFIYAWTQEKNSVEFCEKTLGMSGEATVNWNLYMREVCLWKMLRQASKIGGPNSVVEIYESHYAEERGEKKHGRNLPRSYHFAGVCRETKAVFMMPVAACDPASLLPFVHAQVEPGSTVVTDKWKVYQQLQQDGFCDVRYTFVDPHDPRVHAQGDKRTWYASQQERVKRQSTIKRTFINSYLAEFLWRRNVELVCPFKSILNDIALFSPPSVRV